MRYADTLLADGEHIALRSRQHWLALLVDSRYPLLILLVAILLLVADGLLGNDGGVASGVKTILGYVTLVLVVVGLAWLIRVVWSWYAEDYMITNRRVLKVEGIFNKKSADSSLEKINDAVLSQSLLGRILGYGDLNILTAAEEEVDRYRMLDHAPTFKREMLNQKHALEMDLVRPVSPPLRAAPPPPAPEPSPAPAPSMTADEITATLARLADLRDRGAISAEEYEAKKNDLLSRL